MAPDDVAESAIPAHVRGGTGVPVRRKVYQLDVELEAREKTSLQAALRRAASAVIEWCDGKIPGRLTQAMYELQSDELDQHGLQSLRTVSLIDRGMWACRLWYADRGRAGEPPVSGRTWTIEVVLRAQRKVLRLGLQMFLATRPGADRSVRYDRPSLVDRLAQDFSMHDPVPVVAQVADLDASTLHTLLVRPDRRRSVVVLTRYEGEHGFQYLLDREELGQQLFAIAHCVALDKPATFEWTALEGKEWCVHSGAVRVFRPFLDFAESDPYDHPLTFPDQVLGWKYDGKEGEAAFRAFLIEQRVRDLLDPRIEIDPELTFDRATRDHSDWRKENADYEQLLAVAEEDIKSYRQRADELTGEKESLELDLEAMREQVQDLEREAISLRALNEHYLNLLKGRDVPYRRDRPGSYAELAEWVEREFPGRLRLHNRAVRALKNATYQDIGLVLDCLEFLAEEERAVLRGIDGARAVRDARLEKLGVKLDKSISSERANEEGDAYFVEYPRGSGNRRFLEWHLRKGTSHDPQFTLAIYYCWIPEEEFVLVGSLPAHLDNRYT